MLPDGLEELPGVELLLLEESEADGLDGGDEGLVPGVDDEELSEEELGLAGELGVDEPEEAAPGLDGLDGAVDAPDEDEEDGGGLLVLLPVVLDSLLHPMSAATTAAAQQILARLPKVWSMC